MLLILPALFMPLFVAMIWCPWWLPEVSRMALRLEDVALKQGLLQGVSSFRRGWRFFSRPFLCMLMRFGCGSRMRAWRFDRDGRAY